MDSITITVKDKETRLLTEINMKTADPVDVAETLMALTRKYNFGFVKQDYTFNVIGDKHFLALVDQEARKISAMRQV